jgi:hypothetical protein
LNSGPGGGGTHTSGVNGQASGASDWTQARTNLLNGGGEALVFGIGRHPVSFAVTGAMVTDCTQGTPPHSFPRGIAFSPLQRPPQLAGGSDDVCRTSEPSLAQLAAAAVTFAGSTHEPLVGPHVQASHGIGPST